MEGSLDTSAVVCTGYDIPPRVQVGSITTCALLVTNTSDHHVYFQSHGSFYDTTAVDARHHLSVHVDGVFTTPVLVRNDCLRPGERATLHFTFHAEQPGDRRLQVMIADQHADPVSRAGVSLLDTTISVSREPVRVPPALSIRRGLFALWHTERPLRTVALQRLLYGARLAWWRDDAAGRRSTLARFKALNRDLAFMEKQVRRHRVASLPCYLAIDTTSRCNLECKMCFRSFVDVDYNTIPDMTEELVDRLIVELFPTALTLNLSTGGEPLMSPYVDKILDACAAYHVYLSITTNGTVMRGDEFMARLAAVLHHIEISVDSVRPERFKAFRSGASYDKVLRNATKLGALRRAAPEGGKFNLGFSMTLFRENLEEIPDVLRVVADVGGNFLKADIGVVFSKDDTHQSVTTCPESYNEMYAVAQEQARAAGIRLMMRAPFSDTVVRSRKYGLCDYLYVSACVRSEGTLSPCYFGPALLPLAGSFAAAWNSAEMRQLRHDHDSEKGHALCRSCYVFTDGGSSVEARQRQFLKGDALANV
jgi:MoaA/NifB/PqqE/SkfB family radical SAM enzyme